jgi:hypothetical protein
LVLVGLLVLASLWATTLLIDDLIEGKGNTNRPADLLASGGMVWARQQPHVRDPLLADGRRRGRSRACAARPRWTSRSRST